MKRFSNALVLALVFSFIGNAVAAAQPAMDSGLTLDNIILRVAGDGNWSQSLNADGTPAMVEVAQILNGVPQFELQPSAAALYQKYQVQHVYFYANTFDEMPLKAEPTSTGIEIRLIVFPDEANAQGYLAEAYQGQVDSETSGEVVNARFAPIDPLPASEHPTVGWTFASEYYDKYTNEFSAYASSARYLSQTGRVIVSARASGPMVDFNFDLAYGLLNRQVECLKQAVPCVAVTVTDVTAPGWTFDAAGLGFTDSSGNRTPARMMFPIDEPVRAPEVTNYPATPATPAAIAPGVVALRIFDD